MVDHGSTDNSRIEYSPDWERGGGFPSGVDSVSRRKIIAAEEWMVRERWFFSDISLMIRGENFRYSRAPVIDFFMAFKYSLEILAADGVSKFRVDGGPVLKLERSEGVVVVSDHPGAGISVEFIDLVAACVTFGRKFIDEVTENYPNLLMNDLMERLFRGAGLREMSRDRFLRHLEAARLKASNG